MYTDIELRQIIQQMIDNHIDYTDNFVSDGWATIEEGASAEIADHIAVFIESFSSRTVFCRHP